MIKLTPQTKVYRWESIIGPLLPEALWHTDDDPQQIIEGIQSRRLGCFFIESNSPPYYVGFIVTNFINPTPNITYLNIYVLYILRGQPASVLVEAEKDLTNRIIPMMEDLGFSHIDAITFHSTREKGFTRRLNKLGYGKRLVEFIKWL